MPKKIDPAELLRAINHQITSIEQKWKSSRGLFVVADLREGKAVIANGSFKFDGRRVSPGEEIRVGDRATIDRIEVMLSQPGNSRMFLVREEYEARARERELRTVRDNLHPLVVELEASQREASHCAEQLRAAEEAVKHWSAQLEPAEKRHKSAERDTGEYISKLDLVKLNLVEI
jgi:hypothetical protein